MTSSSLQTEAYAIYKGMSEAHARGLQQIRILSDSTKAVRAIDSQHQAVEITTLVHDIRSISRFFSHWEIRKVSRSEVNIAHNLAVAARQGNFVS